MSRDSDEPKGSDEPRGVRFLLRALRYRNYRLYLGGQALSLVGTWIQHVAMSWLVYRLTNSAFLLGLVGFVGQIPALVLTPFAGILVDRVDRHRILIATQAASMLQALVLAALALSGQIQVWHIVALGAFLGLVNTLDMPARQAFAVEMVERREDLGNAIALNSTMFNSARLIGPSVAGMLIPLVHEGGCFVINGVSYLAVLAALLMMRLPPGEARPPSRTPVLQSLREGFSYAFGFKPLRWIILLLATVSLIGMPYAVLMPVVARDILHGNAKTLGFLMSASGAGALAAALYMASRKTVLGLCRLIALASATFGLGLMLLSHNTSMAVALVLMMFTGAGMMLHMASSNTIIQTLVDDDKRGRVMSIYVMAFIGTAPVGSLVAGTLAGAIGVQRTLFLGGLCCLASAAVFALRLPAFRELVRPLYVRIGVLPDEACLER